MDVTSVRALCLTVVISTTVTCTPFKNLPGAPGDAAGDAMSNVAVRTGDAAEDPSTIGVTGGGTSGRGSDETIGVNGGAVGAAGVGARTDGGIGGSGGSGAAGSLDGLGGTTCTLGTDCASGNCVGGICCDKPCLDTCYACTNALTGSSANGTCAAIASGKDDPQGRCGLALAPTSCGNTGHCNGRGACEKYGSTTMCRPSACGAGSFTPAATCDGNGGCISGAPQDCRGFTCVAPGGCATTCTVDGDCAGGYCSGGTCVAKKIDGSGCAASNECVHGQCVAGICCESACAGSCSSCTLTDTGQPSGLCRPIRAGGSSKGRCAVDAAPCGHDGTCDGNGACRFVASGTNCGMPTCSTSQLRPAPTCNGSGMCAAAPSTSACPGAVLCASATACLPPTCTADGNCVSNLCVSSACMPKRANGQPCTAARECTSNICVDGFCCDRACGGSCEACNATGSVGRCMFVSGAPRVDHPPCTGTGACAATCRGQGAACVFPAAETTCRTASCQNGTATSAAVCDGRGTCPAPSTTTCLVFVPPPSGWTIGAIVGANAECPVGYSAATMTIRSGISVGCASGCGCTSAAMGACTMDFAMTFPDPAGMGHYTVHGDRCQAAWPTSSAIATLLAANEPAQFLPCDGAASCMNCAPSGVTAPIPAWRASMNFCPLANSITPCGTQSCAPPSDRICVLSAGNQPCPAGFTSLGGSGSWFTGATLTGGACSCAGCGVVSGQSCAATTMSVVYGACAFSQFTPVAQFRGDGTSSPVPFNDPAGPIPGWVASELFPALTGVATPGICGAAQPISSGSYTPIGQQTLCCL